MSDDLDRASTTPVALPAPSDQPELSRRGALRWAGGAAAVTAGGVLGLSAVAPGGAAAGAAPAADCPPPPLKIPVEELRANLKQLYTEMADNKDLQAQFVRNPSGMLYERAVRVPLSDDAASAANRLMFSVLNSDTFVQWVGDYAQEHAGKPVPDDQAATDLADAVVRFGDRNVIAALADHAAKGNPLAGFGSVFEQAVCNNAAGQCAITPVAQKQDQSSSQNFNHSSSNIGFSLGDSELISPELLRTVSEQLVAWSRQLDKSGALADLTQRLV